MCHLRDLARWWVFLGRRSIAGIDTGTKMMVDGKVGKYHDKLAMINPVYELLSATDSESA